MLFRSSRRTWACFPEKRFRFLAHLHPKMLAILGWGEKIPLEWAVYHGWPLRVFLLVLMEGIRWFPRKRGIEFLFQKDDGGRTPFRRACEKHGRDEVIKVIEHCLVNCPHDPYDTPQALLSAAVRNKIDLEGVYFLLRREPDVLAKLLFAPTGSCDCGGGGDALSFERRKRQRHEPYAR